ncbi:MAG: hypothetical protein NVSMB32_12680 [Actinomycetota bacterium]
MSTVRAPVGLRIRTEEHGDRAQMFLSGELDVATAPLLDETLVTAQRDHHEVVIDLDQLTFIDSSGIHAFLLAAERAAAEGRQCGIVNCRAWVHRVFQITRKGFLLARQGGCE